MMLMTKFGKFKLRLIATINLSVLLTLFNLASTTSNYWIKYIDQEANGLPHIAGMWRSCPTSQQGLTCQWKNGITTSSHSIWSIVVRMLISFGTIGNIGAVTCLCTAYYFKINKRSKVAIKLMEWANIVLVGSFVGLLIGFCVFISSQCNFSMWLHVGSMCLIAITSNLLTRTFSRLYYTNTRANKCSKGIETGCAGTTEEKIALAQVDKETCTQSEPQMSPVEMNKISEQNGSNEALLPAQNTTNVQPAVNLTESSPVKQETPAEVA